MKTVPDLKELFKQAAEIAQQVPSAMQEAAFNRALEMLTAESTGSSRGSSRKRARANVNVGADRPADAPDSAVQGLIEAIDSTQHPGIASATKVLDRALMVLQVARKEHGIDGLNPGEIAAVLTEKFRVSTTPAAVRMALRGATTLVNRVPRGKAFVYKIMGPGEDYLGRLQQSPTSKPGASGTRREPKRSSGKGRPRSPAAASLGIKAGSSEGGSPRKTQRSGLGSPRIPRAVAGAGPKSSVEDLIKSGYFAQARTGADVQTYLKKKKGLNFGTAQLRLVMLRLVRDEALDRDENVDGQYEYTQPKG